MSTRSILQIIPAIALAVLAVSCQSPVNKQEQNKDSVAALGKDSLPQPFASKSVEKRVENKGWPEGKMPVAPEGFTVKKFAGGLASPRCIYVGPNGDIFVAQAQTEGKSANSIVLLRDVNGDGMPELNQVFVTGLNQPFGMLILNNYFYVANTDGVWMFPYHPGDTKLSAPGKKILDLPAKGYNNHWTRNLLISKDGKKIFVSVGSGSNVAEHGIDHEQRRANILEINPDGSGERVFAYGLRNPVGMAYAPGTSVLWAAVNERDELGDNLVPDYLTSVKEGGFYGWPYSYWGSHPDPRMKDAQRPELVAKAIVPDVNLGSHTASLGLVFDEKGAMPGKYMGGAFIGQHGSWNRSAYVGYQIAFVPFKNGQPTGKFEPFLTGFMPDPAKDEVYGRPVGVAFDSHQHLLVADDAGNTIWWVSAKK